MFDLPPTPDWMLDSACQSADPDIFFPAKGKSGSAAKAICDGCKVRKECLAWALETVQRHGVWGGASARERRRMRVEQRQEREAA